jgi:hypothetical protein
MKLLYQSPKYIRHSKRISRRAAKHRLAKQKRQKSYRQNIRNTTSKKPEWHAKLGYDITIKAPANLKFLDNPEAVIGFITKAERALKENKSLYVDMRFVEKIDYPTITALLAVLYRSRKRGIKINGNLPKDKSARNILTKSGFLYTLFSQDPGAGHKHDISVDNQLFTLDVADLKVVAEIEKTVAECVCGKNRKLPGLYTTIGELMDNTTTHASEHQGETERWWLSINYDHDLKTVSFVFMDYGIGIFTSLLGKKGEHPVKSLLEKAKSLFGVDATDKHLRLIVTESASKAYKLPDGRGQGIYGIYQTLQRQWIENLYIVSNNAFGDISKDSYKKLKNGLNGTLYYWEICDKNV